MPRKADPKNTLHKICPTCNVEFTCPRHKEKKYCCKKCATNSPEVKQKNRDGVAKAFDEKYGGHPMATNQETKDKLKKSLMETYGVEHYSQLPEFKSEVKKTLLDRYGDENYNNIDQMRKTMIERYGVDNYRNTEEYKKKYLETCMKRYGVPHASMSTGFRTEKQGTTYKHSHKLAMFKKFYESEKFKNFTPMFNLDEYDGITVKFNKKYSFKCNRCGGVHDYDLTRQSLRCPTCDSSTSTFQSEVVDYVKSLIPNDPVVVNNRTILSPLELDIFIPSKNLAIETDGLYYHSEVSGSKDKNYHWNKTRRCATNGIRLIHVMENHWNLQRDIVKSILENYIKPNTRKISARKCQVVEVSSDDKKDFLEKNSLDGNDASAVRIGLVHQGELVSIMTFQMCKFSELIEWEVVRSCSKIGVNVLGGWSRMFKHFLDKWKPESVVSYCDRRYFSGETYMKLGFTFVDNLEPSYEYIIDSYDTTESKINWQKCKLEKKLNSFDPALSEWENMKMNGFDRIWDCGHSKWIYRKT